jgi:hypothetical protein
VKGCLRCACRTPADGKFVRILFQSGEKLVYEESFPLTSAVKCGNARFSNFFLEQNVSPDTEWTLNRFKDVAGQHTELACMLLEHLDLDHVTNNLFSTQPRDRPESISTASSSVLDPQSPGSLTEKEQSMTIGLPMMSMDREILKCLQ